uniref:Uncharacterized protein n=1 Tax=Spongospora subterranea TaxID=70186 RepID=A0A0H5R961_9EUKA|eukprot:CRZ10247.1 hypothetical protein [Spongospora subterranea]
MFWDFDVPITLDKSGASRNASPVIDSLRTFGYGGIVLSESVTGKVVKKCSFDSRPISRLKSSFSQATELVQKTRLNVILSDSQQIQTLSSSNACIQSYDIIAIQPTTEKLFYQACQTIDCDIITFDLSDRIPFMLKFPAVNSAIARGIFFEISYSSLISDAASRHHYLSNCLNIVRVTKGRNLIISSHAVQAMLVRGPYDVMNLCALIGLSQSEAKAALAINPQAALAHAQVRRSAQGVCLASNIASLHPENDAWILS